MEGIGSIFRKDITSEATIMAQMMFDEIVAHPRCDTVNGGYTGPGGNIVYKFHKILKGCAIGLAVDDAHKPSAGATVSILRQPGGENDGSGVSDSRGFYETGTPFGRGGTNYKLSPLRGASAFEIKTRRKTVGGVPVRTVAKSPHNFQTPSGQLFRVALNEDDDVVFRGSRFTVPLEVWDDRTVVTDSGDCLTPRVIGLPSSRILVCYEFDDQILEKYSDDSGATWSSELTVFEEGHWPIYACDQTGLLVRAAWVSGSIFIRPQGPGTHDIDEAIEVCEAADDSFGLAFCGGRLWLLYVDGSDDLCVRFSTDDGVSWSDPTVIGSDCTRPLLATTLDGALVAVARHDGALACSVLGPGDLTFSEVADVEFEDAQILIEDDVIGLAEGFDAMGRLVFSALPDGEEGACELVSCDGGATALRVN